MVDSMGDRLKSYESKETSSKLIPTLPVIARLDGKAFHSFTKDLNRPYDQRLSILMVETARYLAEETNALMAYTQSDEITLLWHYPDYKSQMLYDGKIFKLNSILASMCTYFFNQNNFTTIPAFFDCRVWNVPSQIEGYNTLLWREQDATRNSISMAARSVYSHSEVNGKNSKDLQEMLFIKGINWNNYPDFFKRGTYIQKREREYRVVENFPGLSKIENRLEFIYLGADYVCLPVLQT